MASTVKLSLRNFLSLTNWSRSNYLPLLRKSDKRRVDYPVEETPLYLPESEPEIPPIDFESKTCGLEDLQQQIKIEEPIVSTLDDIPGQKELVHCFCGSPEEDGP
jgi:hypothetical protein